MKHIAILAALLVAGCGQSSGVLEVAPGRYRITQETYWSAGEAESIIVAQARAHCATQGKRAAVAMQASRGATSWSYAGASAEFSCV